MTTRKVLMVTELCFSVKYVQAESTFFGQTKLTWKVHPQGMTVYTDGGSLNYAEIVIYNPDAVVPRYIIVYQKDGAHKW